MKDMYSIRLRVNKRTNERFFESEIEASRLIFFWWKHCRRKLTTILHMLRDSSIQVGRLGVSAYPEASVKDDTRFGNKAGRFPPALGVCRKDSTERVKTNAPEAGSVRREPGHLVIRGCLKGDKS